MTVRALFFASYRDIAGTDSIELDLPSGARVADLLSALRHSGGEWSAFPEEPVAAVNMTYAPLNTSLQSGDEVAFIPPVSGG